MSLTVRAYTDFRSPYTYVAKAEAYSWEEDFGVTLDWWPYTTPLQEVFGPADGRNEREFRKIKYMYMNVRRIGAEQGLTIRGTKRIFDPTPAHVGLLQAKDDGRFRMFHDYVFERVFLRELDPDDADHVRAALKAVDCDVAAYDTRLPDGTEELQSINKRAEEEHGVFGVPSFVVDGELYWGYGYAPSDQEKVDPAYSLINGKAQIGS
ncbi:MAG: disulfide bond formation protein DsbA [Hyphomicrobiaceae bacterium TMED74]|nr:disulfide bond formation protein DsbA [Filomicrobium sp.]RPG37155.1 MAG: disulfide bond formation protein DsbA [Hyphomicrobiaceae bacterium TMED74]